MAQAQGAGNSPARVTRTRLISGAVIGGFLLLTAGVVISLVIADRQPADELAIDGEVAGPDTDDAADAGDDSSEPSGDDETGGAAQDTASSDADPDGQPAPDEGAANDGDERDERSDEDARDGASSDADDASNDAGTRQVTVDGRCTAEVDSVEEAASIQAWELEDCASAPVALDDADERWIAVVASFSGGMDESEARERADDMGFDLLWSSHYSSLNPQLWVVFDGPFDDEAAASQAADRIGAGAYPRVVSADTDDRYCIADDGCVGATVE